MERIGTERLRSDDVGGVARAAEILRAGGTVAFPTETVYGLGANALSETAVARIFAAKERPAWDPLIVHIADRAMLGRVALLGRRAQQLAEAFWPGPLTLLLPRARPRAVPDSVTAGRPLVGVRMPAHTVALELIRMAGLPLAAPSANRFGHTSPTTAAHVLEDLDGRIDAVLDGGDTLVGLESTVLDPGTDLSEEAMVIYRPGAVTVAMLEAVCGVGCARDYVASQTAGLAEGMGEGMASPGIGLRHYAPRARLVLVRGLSGCGDSWVERVEALGDLGERVGVMLPDSWAAASAGMVYRWGAWDDAEMLARRLFAGLRELDEAGVSVIVCPVPGMDGMGVAIRDRLEKAARNQ